MILNEQKISEKKADALPQLQGTVQLPDKREMERISQKHKEVFKNFARTGGKLKGKPDK